MTIRPLFVLALALASTGGAVAARPIGSPAFAVPVRPLGLPTVSSDQWESHPAIDPRTHDLWFVRSDPTFSGWHLMISRCSGGRYQPAEAAPIAAKGLEADPWFTPDGRELWFISTRHNGSTKGKDLDIYRVHRNGDGRWGVPERLPAPVNSDAVEWFPRPARDGWLYFGSRRAGGLGGDDIWRARLNAGKRWTVENLGPGINSAGGEAEFQPSPDGRWGILSTDSGLVRVVRDGKGWKRAGAFSAPVNRGKDEIGPLILRNDRSFIFSQNFGPGRSGELMIAGDDRVGPHCR